VVVPGLQRRTPQVLAVLPSLLLVGMAAILLFEAWGDSATYDEARYIRAGYCQLTHRTVAVEGTTPAGFKVLAGAGALAAAPGLRDGCQGADYRGLFTVDPRVLRRLVLGARLPVVGLSLLLAWITYAWAREMWGRAPALVALVLVASEPNLLAHGHLATSDMPLTFGVLSCLAATWWAGRSPSLAWTVVAGVALGAALLSKVSALFLLPVLLVIEAARIGVCWRTALRPSVTAVVAWATLCLAYAPFAGSAGPLAWVAPPHWFAGLHFQSLHVTAGHTFNYLNGEVRVGRGFWSYYLEAMALKTTLGLLLLAGVGAAVAVRHRIVEAAVYLFLPIALLVAAASAGGIDIGVRYVLPAYPLLALAAALPVTLAARRWQRGLLAACVVAAAASSLAQVPGSLGYFNELAGARPEKYLADSNLDWGQDAWRLRDWWEAQGRPAMYSLYFGALPLSSYGIEARELRGPDGPAAGSYVSASLTELTSYGQAWPALRALAYCDASSRVGRSILVSRLPLRRGCGPGAMAVAPGW
jgi:hypothetical protein